MDDRVTEHAEVLVDWSARIEDGADVYDHVVPIFDPRAPVDEQLGVLGHSVVHTVP
jgi:aminopeptidase